jgi:dihydrofolate synthase/folylpolyglutamate synthase
VLAALGHPERRLGAVVHVGGTNGKGSTAAMVAAVARAAGRRVGAVHLAAPGRRCASGSPIDGAPIDEAALVAAYGGGRRGRRRRADVLRAGHALIALEAIARAAVDVTVLEVGLGGRLDATNAVPAPVAAVTGVALDHQELLGHDLRAIAGEKAGIFKPGQRIVIGAAGEPEAVPWLLAAARAAGARAIDVVGDAAVTAAPPSALAGAHQRANVACAVAIVDALVAIDALPALAAARMTGGAGAAAAIVAVGLAAVVHPGRLETVATAPRLVLDGAHNPHGAAALGRYLATCRARPRVLVLAVSADKDVAGMLAGVVGAVDAVIATRYDQPRSMTAAALADRARVHHDVVASAPDLATAVDRARRAAGPDGLVVVAGSLFAVAEVRPRFVPMAIDPIRVGDPGPIRVGDPGPIRVGDPGPLRVGDPAPIRVGDPGPLRALRLRAQLGPGLPKC